MEVLDEVVNGALLVEVSEIDENPVPITSGFEDKEVTVVVVEVVFEEHRRIG